MKDVLKHFEEQETQTKEDRQNTLFIMKPSKSAEKALYYWLRELKPFTRYRDGWFDVNKNPCIALERQEYDEENVPYIERIGVITCLGDSRLTAIDMVKDYLSDDNIGNKKEEVFKWVK